MASDDSATDVGDTDAVLQKLGEILQQSLVEVRHSILLGGQARILPFCAQFATELEGGSATLAVGRQVSSAAYQHLHALEAELLSTSVQASRSSLVRSWGARATAAGLSAGAGRAARATGARATQEEEHDPRRGFPTPEVR